jgi:hypothetical protein
MWSHFMAALLAATAAPGDKPKERNQYVLIVANNESPNKDLKNLRFADDDGARYYELFAPQSQRVELLSVLDSETQQRHPRLVEKAKAPTRAALLQVLEEFHRRIAQDQQAGKEAVFFFVFAGHAVRGAAGEGSIALSGSTFSRADLYRYVLEPSKASFVHLIVDACDSYFFVHSRGVAASEPSYGPLVTEFLDRRTRSRFPNVGVILSTSGQQESHEWQAISSGVFSHQVRSALSGAADINADGRIEYSELRAFVAAANANVQDPRARLQMFAEPPAQDRGVPIVDYTRPSQLAYVMVPSRLSGRYWLEDERGVRAAEFHKDAERALVVVVSPQRNYFLRAADREAIFRVRAAGNVVDASSFDWRPQQAAFRGALEHDLRKNLFSVAYGPSFYSGFISSSGELSVARQELSPAVR